MGNWQIQENIFWYSRDFRVREGFKKEKKDIVAFSWIKGGGESDCFPGVQPAIWSTFINIFYGKDSKEKNC